MNKSDFRKEVPTTEVMALEARVWEAAVGSLHLTYISGHIFSKIRRKTSILLCICMHIYTYIITTCIYKYTMSRYTCECISNMH